MTDRVDQQNVIIELMKSFPELEAGYKREVAAWGEEKQPNNYDIVGFVFKPRFKAELETGTVTDFLRRSARFIESVCKSGRAGQVNSQGPSFGFPQIRSSESCDRWFDP